MVTPPVRWAYAFIAPVALLIAFLGLGEVDQEIVPQTTAVVRADGGAGNERNADLARRLAHGRPDSEHRGAGRRGPDHSVGPADPADDDCAGQRR